MGDPGLPDDWGPSIRCDVCGEPFHASGTVLCACARVEPCIRCERLVPEGSLTLGGVCEDCG